MTAAGRSGVLALLTDPELRDELDRVAAAVGVRVVHAGGGSPVTRKTWTAAAAVVLDPADATRVRHPEHHGHAHPATRAVPQLRHVRHDLLERRVRERVELELVAPDYEPVGTAGLRPRSGVPVTVLAQN